MNAATILAAWIAGGLAACENRPPPPVADAGPRRDAGPDAGPDATVPPPLDAGALDGGGDDAGRRGCRATAAVELGAGVIGAIALSVVDGDAALAWTRAADASEQLVARVEDEGRWGDPVVVADASFIRGPAGSGGDAHRWAWAEGPGEATGYAIRWATLRPDATVTEGGRVDADDGDGAHRPRWTTLDGAPAVAWIRGPTDISLVRRAVDPEGEITLVGGAAAPSRFDLTPLDGRLAWAWIDGRDVRARVDPSPTTVLSLSSEGRAAGGLAVAASVDEVAVVWDVRVGTGGHRELRFRAVGSDGDFRGAERPLTRGPAGGHSPSMVGYAGGYAAAWRGIGETDHVHFALVDALGDERLSLSVAELDGEVVQTAMAGAGGDFVIAWLERRATDSVVRIARVLCNF